METLKSTKVDWKKITVVAALVVLTTTISGLTVWYYMDQQVQTQAEYYEKQLDNKSTNGENRDLKESDTEALPTNRPISKKEFINLLEENDISLNIPEEYTYFMNFTNKDNEEDENSPWYSISSFNPLSVYLGERETGGINFMIYNTTDPNKLKNTGGWESSVQVADEKIGGRNVLVFNIDDNQYMKAIINDGKAYVFGYPTSETIQDMNQMISTLEFK